MNYVFTADLHGKIQQYAKLSNYILENNIEIVFLGGDLWPKYGGRWSPDNQVRTVETQEDFIKSFFLQFVEKIAQQSEVFYILGNDDFAITQRLLKHENDRIHYLDGTKTATWKNYVVVGYPYVGLTPYLQKDWECWDDIGEEVHKKFTTHGFHSSEKGYVAVDYEKPPLVSKTLKGGLDAIFGEQVGAPIVALFHEAPYGTNLDKTFEDNSYNGSLNLGSKSLIAAIKKYQPVISLHGHIHESVQESGSYWQKVGKTIMFNPGNGLEETNISLICGNLEHPDEHTRITL